MTPRERAWRSLTDALAQACPRTLLLKNADSALHGTGDLDLLLPKEDMGGFVRVARDWCLGNGGQSVVCHHVPDGPHVVIVLPEETHALVLDVKWRRSLFGATLITAESAAGLSVPSELGPGQLRSGAESMVKACLYGIDRGPGLNRRRLREQNVADGLRADPDGAALAARAMHPPTALLTALRRAVERDTTAIGVATATKAVLGTIALSEPGTAWHRGVYKALRRQRCPVMRVVRYDRRRIPQDREAWLTASRLAHGSTDD